MPGNCRCDTRYIALLYGALLCCLWWGQCWLERSQSPVGCHASSRCWTWCGMCMRQQRNFTCWLLKHLKLDFDDTRYTKWKSNRANRRGLHIPFQDWNLDNNRSATTATAAGTTHSYINEKPMSARFRGLDVHFIYQNAITSGVYFCIWRATACDSAQVMTVLINISQECNSWLLYLLC